jgi:diaminohydroxyphosphoribosylaminopyrimidine deaminase/5-amino-6-(5-phosphoribosylamino)uracil reductase
MRLAVQLASGGVGFVSPNPLVGCVILDRDMKLLTTGFHRRVGHDHAEVDALRSLGYSVGSENAALPTINKILSGAHVFVTLEPCAHQGRTPSCARTLAQFPIASLTYAIEDPSPLVAGKGAAILREAQIATVLFSDRDDVASDERQAVTNLCEELAEVFLHCQRRGAPFVAVKVASSLDGMLAYRSGESQWITGPESRARAHQLRASYDAVLVGRATVQNDNPALNVRHERFAGFQNRAVIIDPEGKTLPQWHDWRFVKVRQEQGWSEKNRVFYIVSNQFIKKIAHESASYEGLQLIGIDLNSNQQNRSPNDQPGTQASLDVSQLLRELLNSSVNSVLVEGGAQTIAAFFHQSKVQRLHAFVAPALIGGASGLPWSNYFGGKSMKEKIQLQSVRVEALGVDQYWSARVL